MWYLQILVFLILVIKKIINLEHVSCWPHPASAGCGVPQSVAEKRLTVLVVKKLVQMKVDSYGEP
jgi:hypothetical protein